MRRERKIERTDGLLIKNSLLHKSEGGRKREREREGGRGRGRGRERKREGEGAPTAVL